MMVGLQSSAKEKLELAQAIAGRAIVADLLELQRLNAQLQQLQQWLSS